MSERSQPKTLNQRTSARHPRVGTSPGTLSPIPGSGPAHIRAIAYETSHCEEKELQDPKSLKALAREGSTLWVNVDGLGDLEVLKRLGADFGLPDLALEDVLAVHHRAKFERYENLLFLVLRMPEHNEDGRIETDQLSLFLGPNFVLTFQHAHGDCFDAVRDRIRSGKGRIRGGGTAYLLYALIDAVVDSYYPMLERVGDGIDTLEEEILETPGRACTMRVHELRRDLLVLRRAVWPLREILNDLMRDEDTERSLQPYLRDCYDHVVELIDLIETYRDLAAGLMEVYVSIVGNKMNEIMKVLTIIATIFIPLSFIASVYGMNFDTSASPFNMPELSWRYGYVACLGLMLSVAITMLVWFRRRGWMDRSNDW